LAIVNRFGDAFSLVAPRTPYWLATFSSVGRINWLATFSRFGHERRRQYLPLCDRSHVIVNAFQLVRIDPHGWSLEPEDGDVVLTSPDSNAELHIAAQDFGAVPSLGDLHTIAHRRCDGSDVRGVTCGQFSGVCFDANDESENQFIREFVVSLAEIVLFVTFSCPAAAQQLYVDSLSQIVSSFRDNRP
jgi:hypothetical protein